MDKVFLWSAAAVVFLLFAFILHNYVFSIYETAVGQSRSSLSADGISEAVITAVPLNGLGFRAPFRKAETEFVIEEGRELVEVIKKDKANGELRLRAKFEAGKVVILVRPKFALLPTRIVVLIEANVG